MRTAVLLLVLFLVAGCNSEAKDWQAAQQDGTPEACEQFLKEHPDGEHAAEARALLASLRESEAWRKALQARDIALVEAFLRDYPQSQRLDGARRMLEGLREERGWEATRKSGDYEGFLKRHPAGQYAGKARDRRDWVVAQKAGTSAGYEAYLRAQPMGEFIDEARQRRDRLQDEEDWKSANAKPSLAAMRTYLARHPEGGFAAEARQTIAKLEETRAWEAAQRTGTLAAYEAFLKQHPESAFGADARQRIEEISTKPTRAQILTAIEKELRANAFEAGTIRSDFRVTIDIVKIGEFDPATNNVRVDAHTGMEGGRSRFTFGFIDHFLLTPDGKGGWTAKIVHRPKRK